MPQLDRSSSTTEWLLHWAQHTPNAAAMIESSDRSYSYGDLAVSVVQYATALRASGIPRDSLVGIQCERRYLHLILILACELIGTTSMSFLAKDIDDADDMLDRCGFLCIRQPPAKPPATAGLLHLTQDTIDRIGGLKLPPDGLGMLASRPMQRQVVRLVRTSGSTGRPKVMAMTQEATLHLLERTATCEGIAEYDWNFINLYNYALRSAVMESMLTLRLGRTLVSSYFETLLSDLTRFRQCHLTLLSGDAVRLAQMPIPAGWPGQRRCLLNVKGGPLALPIRQALLRDFVSDIVHSYATNETYRLAISDDRNEGVLCPGVAIRIVDDDGREIRDGQPGLIEARSSSMVDGYLWDAAATQVAFVNGWYRTDDIGYLTPQGRLVVLGRADDMLNIGGIKLAPQRLEEQIRAIDGVQEAVLLAVPGASGAGELNVVIELRQPACVPEIRSAIHAIVTPYARQFVLRAMGPLPRTATGKVQRGVLRKALVGAGYGSNVG